MIGTYTFVDQNKAYNNLNKKNNDNAKSTKITNPTHVNQESKDKKTFI